jgi:TRAP-type C4-dicarboxylate transport system permease small subunit
VRDEFKMRVRVITRGMTGLLYARRLLNPFRFPFVAVQLLSHKVARWMIPIVMLLLLTANAFLFGAGWFYLLTLAGQAAFYLAALLGVLADRLGYKVRLLAIPMYFCVVNVASLISLFNVARGDKKVVWETARN